MGSQIDMLKLTLSTGILRIMMRLIHSVSYVGTLYIS